MSGQTDVEKGQLPAADFEGIDKGDATPSTNPSLDPSIGAQDETKPAKDLSGEVYPESDMEKGLVGWEGQDDPENPRNFTSAQKIRSMTLIAAITFLSPLISTISAPGVSYMDAEFHNSSSILASLAVSIFVLGFAAGPLIISPLSEIYGRQIVLNICNSLLTLWQIGCALAPNIGSLIAFRFLAGAGGSACLSIGGGIISDLFTTQQRGLAASAYTFGALFGPIIGPMIGGFIAQRAGWRWAYWVALCAAGVVSVGNIFLSAETSPTILLRRKTNRLRKELTRPELQSVLDAKSGTDTSSILVLRRGMIRPLRMLFLTPILLCLSTYVAFVFGLLYLLFTTLTSLYINTYHWQPELCGLAYLGLGLGCMTGIITVAKTSDATIIRLTKANNGVYEPEMRLASCVLFALFVPISFFWYGWSADYAVHWIVPILGLIPFGFGMMGILIPVQTYFIDVGGHFAASALSGLTAFRCLFGGLLPLAGPKMYEALGLGWGNSLLGFLSLGLIPVPAIIYKYGGAIRKKWPIQLR
ncbi:hypothetical protein TMatcc_009453 [Talaromyces marneffei ATCC 18224]|uniref:Major facilitator superfamily (MFS) profile domain-containing protein n=2 Tax=Talaromyces marneffei TaxID=37727 RepID=B6QSE9_TALMQ|nr:uncharacterized protein EYB26_008699 [Talaromyces marneffei]EEA19316.1 conserved hypothetical protein [Talaromyces marneffei ATCC 18224]QGA20989.1 hypothetical protein EYB26_008699 [Talaromyces marneffei]